MIGITLLALALAAKPASPPVSPTGPWYVRAEENMCLLERRYVIGDQTIALIFQPLLDLEQMELFVIEPGGGGRQYVGTFSAEIARAEQPYTGRYFSVSASKSRVTRLTTERRLLNDLKDGDTLRIQARPVDQSFTIKRPEKVRGVLQECIDGLKKSWGINLDVEGRAVTPLEGNPARYFGPNSYPPEAYQQGIYGRVIALLNIDATGAVTNCRIVSSAGPALNEGTCTAARRIRFKPARDKEGQPLPSSYVLPVRWVLPNSPESLGG